MNGRFSSCVFRLQVPSPLPHRRPPHVTSLRGPEASFFFRSAQKSLSADPYCHCALFRRGPYSLPFVRQPLDLKDAFLACPERGDPSLHECLEAARAAPVIPNANAGDFFLNALGIKTCCRFPPRLPESHLGHTFRERSPTAYWYENLLPTPPPLPTQEGRSARFLANPRHSRNELFV